MNRRATLGLIAGGALFAPPVHAQDRGRRAAFVVGVSDYQHATPLKTPRADATEIAAKLRDLRYATVLRLDPTQDVLLEDLYRFRSLAKGADLVVLYLAGHGVQFGGETYLIPRDGDIAEDRILHKALSVNAMVGTLSDRVRNKVIFVDTCRESFAVANEWKPARTGLTGLHATFAAQPGQLALDEVDGRSPFAAALIKLLGQPGLDIDRFALKLRLETLRRTGGQQVPWTVSTLLTPLSLDPLG